MVLEERNDLRRRPRWIHVRARMNQGFDRRLRLTGPGAWNSQVEALAMPIETRKSVPAIRICKRVVMVMSSFD
jgi:hypothetical protein